MNATLKKIIQLSVVTLIVLFGLIFSVTDVYAIDETRDLACSGSGYCGTAACNGVWTTADTDFSYINSAWRGSYRQWDDVAANRATVNGVEKLYERSDNLDRPGWNTSHPDCGCGDSGCAGSDNPGGIIFFQRLNENNVTITMTVSAEEKYKRNGAPGAFVGTAAFGVSKTVCAPGTRNISGQCVPITGTLTATPTTCNSPCDVFISWNTNSLNNARVVRDSSVVVYSGNSVPTGSVANLSLSAGTYTYCLTGYDGNSNITADLECETVTVNNPVGGTTSAPVCSPANPPTVVVGEPAVLTGSGGNGSFSWTAQGGSPATWVDGVGQTTSTFSPTFATPGVHTVLVRDGLDRTSNPCNVTVINPSGSSNAYVYISATPASGAIGSASTLQWTVYNATSCYANGGWSGPKDASSGNNTESITINSSPIIYSITCSNANNGTSMTHSVTVSPTGVVGTGPLCGNNEINAGEACDTGSARGACPSTCSTSCTLNSCFPPVGTRPSSDQSCGNGIIEGSEACDKGSSPTIGNGTCYAQCSKADVNGMNGCTITSVCAPAPTQVCPNGITEGYEQCDEGPANGNCTATLSPRCSTQCRLNACNPPTVTLRANPATTPYYSSPRIVTTSLSWDVTNSGGGCSASASILGTGWHGPQDSTTGTHYSSGTIRYISDDMTFTLTCTSRDGQIARSSVTVYREQPPKANLVITNFSVMGEDSNRNLITKNTFQVNERVYPSVTVRNNSNMTIDTAYINSFFKNRALPITTFGVPDDIHTNDGGGPPPRIGTAIPAGEDRTYTGIGSNFIRWNENYVSYGAPGTYVARMFVDSGNSIDESNESTADNQLTTIITIVGAPVPAPVVTLTAPLSVVSGTGVPLTWSATNNPTNPTSCTASASPITSPWSGVQFRTGTVTTAPITGQTVFTLTCINSGGTGADSKTVNVTAAIPSAPVITISANPSSGTSPLLTRITWSATNNPTSCSGTVTPAIPPIPSWSGPKAASGFLDFNLTASKTFNLGCRNAGGINGDSVDVTVFPAAPVATNKTLTITTPVINGKVTSADTFIDCGVGGNPLKCSRMYTSVGCSPVTLTAIPSSSSWRFTGWGGACAAFGTGICNLNLCGDSSVSANFGRRSLIYQEF